FNVANRCGRCAVAVKKIISGTLIYTAHQKLKSPNF
ncbi:MAG: bacterioferritin-associated ferredoxin, partial [Flavobacteriales bacterium]